MYYFNKLFIFFYFLFINKVFNKNIQLMTTNNNFMSLISGFTAQMHCSLYKCGLNSADSFSSIEWFKDDVLLFNGTDFNPTSGIEPSRIVLQRSPPLFSDGCTTEEFTLLLKNLTLQDAGNFRCQLANFPQQLDFHLDVLESGLHSRYYENFTYDYTMCCLERGLSPLCRPMCKPQTLSIAFFDPTSCETNDFKNFLDCVTDSGRRNYVPCCRKRFVPSFCHDFCSNRFQMLKRSHRLCLYYLPEIFECFNKQFDQFPPHQPFGLTFEKKTELISKLCWKSLSVSLPNDKTLYSIHIKTVPDIMLKGTASIISNMKSLVKTNRRARRDAVVLVAQESVIDKNVQFTSIESSVIERDINKQLICIPWSNWIENESLRYVVYVQAANDYGTSEPSQPLFISVKKKN